MTPAAALIALALGRPLPLVDMVCAQAIRAGVDQALACAVVEVENGRDTWRTTAVRREWDGSTSYGLMQINSQWWPQFRGNLRLHVYMGCVILAYYLREERGDVRRALSRYNTGHQCATGRAYAEAVLATCGLISAAVLWSERDDNVGKLPENIRKVSGNYPEVFRTFSGRYPEDRRR
jgi:soluble lytic murein transglycosylase-like protein